MTKQISHYAPTSVGMLQPLSAFLDDVHVNEILINEPHIVFVERYGSIEKHEVPALTERHLYTLFQLLASENQQLLDDAHPMMSGSLLDGSRIQLIIPPTSKMPAMSIRRKVSRHQILSDYESMQYYKNTTAAGVTQEAIQALSTSEQALLCLYQAKEWSEFIKKAVLLKKTIVISGGTSSGKTTYLNACLQAVPLHERLLILEDTREIHAPHENQLALLASKGEQGLCKVSMQDLVQASLRLRPDRIIVGEIRGKEMLDFLAAASTGHEGSMTSLHASSPKLAFMRMAQMYKLNNVPSMTDKDIYRELMSVIDIVVQLEKTSDGRQAQSIFYRYGHLK